MSELAKNPDDRHAPVRRVCILTGGGDAPGLNPVLRAFVKAAIRAGIEVIGSEDGFSGLMEDPVRVVPLTDARIRGILHKGGSVLGCSNRANPFAHRVVDDKGQTHTLDLSSRIKDQLQALGCDALVLVGGDGTMNMGMRFWQLGVPIVGIPKTIDNDLAATDRTFGLDTAVTTATWAIDTLHSTAEAHDRVMIVELMGRDAGWIAMHSGLAGGADVILIPEIPYDLDRVVDKVRERSANGRTFSVIVIGEGAKPIGGTIATLDDAREGQPPRLGGAGQQLEKLLEGQVRHEIRVTVVGHLQRGGSPSSFDRILGSRFGVHAAHMCEMGIFGRVVALKGNDVTDVPIEATVANLKRVPPDGELVAVARALGIEMGQP